MSDKKPHKGHEKPKDCDEPEQPDLPAPDPSLTTDSGGGGTKNPPPPGP